MGSSLVKTIQKYQEALLTCAFVKEKKKIHLQNVKVIESKKIVEKIDTFDVLIDFSTPQNTLNNLNICKKYNKNIVIGTTGFNEIEIKKIKKYSNDIGIIISANFSVGINLLFKLIQDTAKILDQTYDVEILESHHRNKIDSPSGTALQIGDIIAKNKQWDLEKCSIYRKKEITNIRKNNKIGFAIIRGGDTIGEHQVMFLGNGEKITLSHHANNRNTFSKGAIDAAIWIKNKKSGLFNMNHVLNI